MFRKSTALLRMTLSHKKMANWRSNVVTRFVFWTDLMKTGGEEISKARKACSLLTTSSGCDLESECENTTYPSVYCFPKSIAKTACQNQQALVGQLYQRHSHEETTSVFEVTSSFSPYFIDYEHF